MSERLFPYIQELARQEGIPLVGVASPSEYDASYSVFREWLDAGFHAQMLWMENHMEFQRNPGRIFPHTRSILVFGFPYRQEISSNQRPRISRYAWSCDYHWVVRKKLSQILKRLKDHTPQVEGRIFVDSSPIPERELAVRAGLGWIGKNTCLIHPEYGSYLFLGEIFLNIPLPPSNPMDDLCGNCTLCLEACPLGALVKNRLMDARRCISYLTIENREIIPLSARNRLQGWLFGCDLCQEACPFNTGKRPKGMEAFSPLSRILSLEPEGVLAMSGKAFKKAFGETALFRARHKGLVRNIIALLPELPGTIPPSLIDYACRRYPIAAEQYQVYFTRYH